MEGRKLTQEYVIHRDGWKDWFTVHVSKTKGIMQRHIKNMDRKYGWKVDMEGFEQTLGCVQPVYHDKGCFAIMFLNEQYLGAGTVAHECLHVAMAHERHVLQFGMDYGAGITKDEERLAYYLTDVVKAVYTVLYENGHAKPEYKTKGRKE